MAKGKKDKWWTINKDLLPLKVFYFLCYGACMVIPYVTILLKLLNLTASEIGIITGSSVILCMITRPAIGLTADRLGGRKILLVVCCLGFGSTFFCLQFIDGRSMVKDSYLHQHISNSTSINNDFTVNSCQNYHRLTASSLFKGNHSNQDRQASFSSETNVTKCHIWNHNSSEMIETFKSSSNRLSVSCPVNISSLPRNLCLTISINKSNLLYTIMIVNHKHLQQLNILPTTNYKPPRELSSPNQNTSVKLETFSFESNNYLQPDYYKIGSRSTFSSCFENCNNIFESSAEIITDELIRFQLVNQSATHSKTLFKKDTDIRAVTLDSVFVLSIVVTMIARVFYASTNSLADAAAYSLLGSNRHHWAKQRIWGSLGTGIAIFVSTAASKGVKQNTDISSIFTACLFLTVMASTVVVFKLNTTKIPKNSNLSRDLKKVLNNPMFRLLLCKLILFGYMTGAAQIFMLWFVAELGGSNLNLAMVVVVNSFSSVLILRFTGMMLKRLGPQWTMSMVLVAHVIRYLCTSFIESPWIILVTELLHGMIYSTLWAAASGSTSLVAPQGTQATCQSIAGAVYWDLGRGLGSLVTGQLIQAVGARWTFRSYAGICVVALLLFYVLDRIWPMPKLHVSREDDGVDKQTCLEENHNVEKCETTDLLQIKSNGNTKEKDKLFLPSQHDDGLPTENTHHEYQDVITGENVVKINAESKQNDQPSISNETDNHTHIPS